MNSMNSSSQEVQDVKPNISAIASSQLGQVSNEEMVIADIEEFFPGQDNSEIHSEFDEYSEGDGQDSSDIEQEILVETVEESLIVADQETVESIVMHDTSKMSPKDILCLFQKEGVSPTVEGHVQGAPTAKYRAGKLLKQLEKFSTKNNMVPIKPVASCKTFICYQYDGTYSHTELPYVDFDPSSVDIKRRKKVTQVQINDVDHHGSVKEEKIFLPQDFAKFKQKVAEFCYQVGFSGQEVSFSETPSLQTPFKSTNEFKELIMNDIEMRIHKLIVGSKSQIKWFDGLLEPDQQGDPSDEESCPSWEVHLEGQLTDVFRFGQMALLEANHHNKSCQFVVEILGSKLVKTLNKYQTVVTAVTIDVLGQEATSISSCPCKIASFPRLNHLLKEAEVIYHLERQRLHHELIHPKLTSLSSGIEINISNNFKARYKDKHRFYENAIQKVVDTVALNQDNISNLFVINDHRASNLDMFVTDCLKKLIEHQHELRDPDSREISQEDDVQETFITRPDRLYFIVTSCDTDVLSQTARRLHFDLGCDVYYVSDDSQYPSQKDINSRIVQLVEEKVNDGTEGPFKDVQLLLSQNPMADFDLRPVFEDEARKQLILSCQCLVGTTENLLNDPIIAEVIDREADFEDRKYFDIAIVHEADKFNEAELLALQWFEVRKMILMGSTTRSPEGQTVMHRMVEEFEKDTSISGSKSAVICSFVEDEKEKQNITNRTRDRGRERNQEFTSRTYPTPSHSSGRGQQRFDGVQRNFNTRGGFRGGRGGYRHKHPYNSQRSSGPYVSRPPLNHNR